MPVRNGLKDNRLTRIEELLHTVLDRIVKMNITLGDIQMDIVRLEASIARVETVAGSAVALINALAEEIRNTAPDAAALAALADRVDASADTLAAAVVANTPAAPVAPVDPEAPAA